MESVKRQLEIAILTAGQWGRALAHPLAQNGHRVSLWIRRPEALNELLTAGEIPRGVTTTHDPAEAVSKADLVVFVPAARALREVCRLVKPAVSSKAIFVSASKSLDPDTLIRMSELIAEEIPIAQGRVVVLSGPNFAVEVARGLPTVTVAACRQTDLAHQVQDAFMTPRFRVYTNPDIIGVELGGALKNVIAIAVGIAEGLDLGHNAGAALITRGLAEIARLGMAAGANPLTFAGLSGLGDLVLTCTGSLSRNRGFGVAVGRGQDPKLLIDRPGLVVEGIRTTAAARSLAVKSGIDMPITQELHAVLFEGKSPRDGVMSLMSRSPSNEWDEEVANFSFESWR